MSNTGLVNCCHRRAQDDEHTQNSPAICQRVLDIAGLQETHWGQVKPDACLACGGETTASPQFFNSVLASLLYEVTRNIEQLGGIPDLDLTQVKSLKQYAEAGLRSHTPLKARVTRISLELPENALPVECDVECDVVVNLTQHEPLSPDSLESLRQQRGCTPTLHIVCHSGTGRQAAEEFANDSRTLIHFSETPLSEIEAVHLIAPECHSEFIAIHSPHAIARPDRLHSAVQALVQHQGEIFGSAMLTEEGKIPAEAPAIDFCRTVPVETLVFRRSSLIDCGGVGQLETDHDLDLIVRFVYEERKFVLSEKITVACNAQFQTSPARQPPSYKLVGNRMNHHAVGFPQQEALTCDVVLPFRDQLEYVNQAIESVLEQENCETVIHLIDDASRQSTEEFFDRWSQYSNIRLYRNRENLGQYTSFNNALKYCETGFVAIQDGDDISNPDRIATAVNSLLLAGADIFSASIEMFGNNYERRSSTRRNKNRYRPVEPGSLRTAKLPSNSAMHFIINGAAVMKLATVRELGGFADFGSPIRNRGGLDTEFYLRALHSRRVRFFISKHLAGKYRRHEASATQNHVTGFGSSLRYKNREEILRRQLIFLKTDFQPSDFGALGRYQHLTQPLG
ncbi:glycosyltransferase family 2 protein [Thalassoglobus polymorphus]|uniref:N-glycosyltransferase n=1 Tax=Thalassoglobus polymorphus TaxID=2527994 RepID=A0A517QVA9_9PLAN|nr:glycosyltransferase family 2 protein [Thalassoglobus polymorphus]QDT35560.1 N-glycosyltransferase [Thalassoglobus polymorphus]